MWAAWTRHFFKLAGSVGIGAPRFSGLGDAATLA
jgi:hypothetical protein